MLLVDLLSDELRRVAQRREQRLAAREAGLGEVEQAPLLDVDLPLGSSRRYARNCWSAETTSPTSSRSSTPSAKRTAAKSGLSWMTRSSSARAWAVSPMVLWNDATTKRR